MNKVVQEIKTPVKIRGSLIAAIFILLAIIIFGLLWLFFLAPSQQSGFGWYLFSFAAGLSMIVLPCTLPLAFFIVPLSLGKGVSKGLGIALSFGAGVALMLSLYGVIAAAVGGAAISGLGADLETVKNWVYLVAGIFALLFALGEIGLVKFKLPSYTGAAPAFIQKKGDFIKAFLLGMFLGNIGVGCPHPATPLILVEIASSGQVFYGWTLFLIHAIGRVLPLLFLALLGILGVNGLSWLVARKDKVEKATGWAMVFVAGFILTLGLFTHDWWVNSGIHTKLESLTQEERLLGIVTERFGAEDVHSHGLETGTALFGLPLWLGNWFLVMVWLVPLWWWLVRERRRILKKATGVSEELRKSDSSIIHWRESFLVVLSGLLILTFVYILPHNFIYHEAIEETHTEENMPQDHDEDVMMNGHDEEMGEMDMMHGHEAIYHEESAVESGVSVNIGSYSEIKAGVPTNLVFYVNKKPESTPILNLELDHEKYLHVIGVRDDLTHFFHIHPNNTGSGFWNQNFAFNEEGRYKIWSDISYGGVTHTFGHPFVKVQRGATSKKSPTTDVQFFKNVIVDKYQVGLDHSEPLVKGEQMQFIFSFEDLFGNGVLVEPYLGADMHLVVIKDDLSNFVHAHPSEVMGDGKNHSHSLLRTETAYAHSEIPASTSNPQEVSFSINFPTEGIYKLFGQFRPKAIDLPQDVAILAEFYVKVEKEGESVPPEHGHETANTPSRAAMFLISIILIGVLSYAVRRFLRI